MEKQNKKPAKAPLGVWGKIAIIGGGNLGTAIAITESMTWISHSNATSTQLNFVQKLFEKLGKVAIIEDKLMDAVTI